MTRDEEYLQWWLAQMRRMLATLQRDRRRALILDGIILTCVVVSMGAAIKGAIRPANNLWLRWVFVVSVVFNGVVLAVIARNLRVTWIRLKLMERGMRHDIALARGLATYEEDMRHVHGDAPVGDGSDG